MKFGILCLFLLSACSTSNDAPAVYVYALTWTCRSPEGCERTEAVERIDRMERVRRDCQFTSTQDEMLTVEATQIASDILPEDCVWLSFLSLFGHELPQSKACYGPGGFDLELSIPNEDPATASLWLVEGRDLDLL